MAYQATEPGVKRHRTSKASCYGKPWKFDIASPSLASGTGDL
ncbi:hypothetical protein [Streptomyces pratensis]